MGKSSSLGRLREITEARPIRHRAFELSRAEQGETDLSYFRRRASEERTAAIQARDPAVRKSHLQMAERYEDLVRSMAGAEL